jgi:hypothetical protein
MSQTNQNKVGILLRNSATPYYDSAHPAGDRAGGGGVIADYNFAVSSSLAAQNGFNFTTARPVTTPSGESDAGLEFSWTGDPHPLGMDIDQETIYFDPMTEFWWKQKFFVPANYFHRQALELSVAGDLTTWQVGDVITGVGGVHTGTLYYKDGATVFLLFAADSGNSGTWTGTITNTTRGNTRSSTRIFTHPANNKFLVFWCDGYSGAGQGSTIAWELYDNAQGGSEISYHFSGDGSGLGQIVNSTSSSQPFIKQTTGIAKWHEFICRIKMATTGSAEDGIIEAWHRVEGEGSYTKLWSQTNAKIGQRTGAGNFRNGYMHGWANSGFAETTLIHNTRVILSGSTIDGVV